MAIIILIILLTFKNDIIIDKQIPIPQEPQLNILIRGFLASKKSPLASETDFLLQQKHWKLLIAISAIESQYCKRQLGNNCFGLGGDYAYRQYSSYRASIIDANDLIESWQRKGKWLTVESMNCSWVVPCNPNWVKVVNQILNDLYAIIP